MSKLEFSSHAFAAAGALTMSGVAFRHEGLLAWTKALLAAAIACWLAALALRLAWLWRRRKARQVTRP
jgi:hypothetical protein